MDASNLAGIYTINTEGGGLDMEQLSGVMIIIIIGGGVLIFVVLFIFAKRQITRFTIRSRRGPQPVGSDAPKSIRREIERRLDCVQRIAYEPKLIWDDDHNVVKPAQKLPSHYYRMRAVDDIKILEKEIARADGSVRYPHDSLRAFLLVTLASAVQAPGQRFIHQFCDMYEHARHDPAAFGLEEYETYHSMLLKLIESAKTLKSFANSRKTSPSRTPVKKQGKMHSLDASRLRPPPLNTRSATHLANMGPSTSGLSESKWKPHTKASLTLGLQQSVTPDEDVVQTIELQEKEAPSIA